MPILLLLGKLGGFAAKNWKPVGLVLLILGIGGYIVILRNSIAKQEALVEALKTDITTVKGDLEKSNAAIKFMADGMEQYKNFVDLSLDSIKQTQNIIAKQNMKFLKVMDNLAILAQEARRIQDAPRIPFFMSEDAQENKSIPVSVDNGVYRYRMLPPAP